MRLQRRCTGIAPGTGCSTISGAPFYRWFRGGRLNTCFNAVDRHVAAGRGAQAAIIHDSPVTSSTRTITYGQLQDLVARFAGALVRHGVAKGDRVIVYMPMVPEALVAMLACARIGAVHSVVFGGFAANELATRIDDAKPTMIVSASCGVEGAKVLPYKPLLDRAIELAAHKPRHTIVLQRPQVRAEMTPGRDLDWADAMQAHPVDCVPVEATDPLYILYTSGTTGQPKGVVRDHGGHATALLWTMRNIYGVEPGEVFWAASDVGWVVGHSYICYGPLLNGNTTIVYEGKPVGTPDPGAFWRVRQPAQGGGAVHRTHRLSRHQEGGSGRDAHRKVRSLLAAHPVPRRRALRSGHPALGRGAARRAGDRPLVADRDRLGDRRQPVGVEKMPVRPGSPTLPMVGYDVQVLDEGGEVLPAGKMGSLCIRLPMPPGCLATLWQADARFRQSYLSRYPGWYLTGDAGYKDADGYLYIMSRIDDVINVAGHRLSTGAVEEVLASHPDVAECAVIGVDDPLKGELPLGLVGAQGGRHPCARSYPTGAGGTGARPDRRGGGVQAGGRRLAPAEDPLGQDPARDDEEDRRQQRVQGAGDHRRPDGSRGDRREPEGAGLCKGRRRAGLNRGGEEVSYAAS